DSGYLRPRDVELLYAPQSLFFLGHPAAALLDHVGDQKHVWAVGIHLEPLGDMLSKHARRKGAEAFAVLDLQIHDGLHSGRTRVADDAASAASARAELHPSLAQPDDLFRRQKAGHDLRQLLAAVFGVRVVVSFKVLFDLLLRVAGAEV